MDMNKGSLSRIPLVKLLIDVYEKNSSGVLYLKKEGPEGALTAIATDVVDYELAKQTFSYRTKSFRYIMYPNGQEELYELDNDPNEWLNLAKEEAYLESKKDLKNKVLEMIRK